MIDDEFDRQTFLFRPQLMTMLSASFRESGQPADRWSRSLPIDMDDNCPPKEAGPDMLVIDFNKAILPDNPYHYKCRD
jgi:hypothetical protein